MGQLINLEGTTRKSIDALFIENGEDVKVIINNNYAATAAGTYGAINIWKDDSGDIRCEAMRNCSSLEKKTYKRIASAVRWANLWLEVISFQAKKFNKNGK